MTPEQARQVQQAAGVCAAELRQDEEAVAALGGLPPSAFHRLRTVVEQTDLRLTGRPVQEPPPGNPIAQAVWALDRLSESTNRTSLEWAQDFALGAARET